jgi:hypothetical protein
VIEATSIVSPDLDGDEVAELSARGFYVGDSPIRYRSLFPQIELLRLSHSWFRLEPTTLKILNAFNLLNSKIAGRLKDKKDLRAVIDILDHLETYLYSAIPEISSTEHQTSKEIEKLGEQALSRFAEAIEPLPVYRAEVRPLEGKEKVTFKFAAAIAWIAALFGHENLLVRFFSWWVLIQTLVFVCLSVAWHYVPSLKWDSSIVSLSIGTPLVVAAAALAGSLKKK